MKNAFRGSARRQNRNATPRRRLGAFESLERRQMFSITAAVSGNVVGFLDDVNGVVDNKLTLGVFAATGELAWSVNGGAFTTDLDSATPGNQTRIFDNLEQINVLFGVGDDSLALDLSGAAFSVSPHDLLAGPVQTTDLGWQHTGSGSRVQVFCQNVEFIEVNGAGEDDSLAVSAVENSHMTVQSNDFLSSSFISSDRFTTIYFRGLNNVGIFGTPSTLTVKTREGLSASPIQLSLNVESTLIIEGTAASDIWQVGQVAGGSLLISDLTGNGQVELANGSTSVHVKFRGLAGNDSVQIHVDPPLGVDVVKTPITFEGGAGNDVLTVSGIPPTLVDQLIYTAESTNNNVRLRYVGSQDEPLMAINLKDVEIAVDTVTANEVVVHATAGVDNITFGPSDETEDGFVAVSRHTTLHFGGKSSVILDGAGGNDTFNIANSDTEFSLLQQIVINGGPKSGYDRVIVSDMGKHGVATKTTISAAGFVPIAYSNIDRLRFDRATLVDVSALIKIVATSGSTTGFPTQTRTLTFKNKSAISVEGSFVAIFTLPAGVTVDNGTAFSKFADPGKPFIRFNIGAGRLEPSTTVDLNVRFRFANISAFNKFKSQGFTVALLAGNGAA